MKRFFLLVLVGIAALSLMGGASFAKDPKDMQVVLIVKDLVNPFFVELKWGGYAAAKQYGVNYSCLAPEKYSVDNQIRIMEDLIQKKVDAIVLIPIDGKGIVSGIERANKAGVPVFICNTKAQGGQTLGFAGIDHITVGRTIAQYVADRLKGKGKIVILEGTTGASTAIERKEGVMQVLKKYPEIEILESTTAKYNRQMGMKVTEDLLIRFPKIDAILAVNDAMALGAKEAVKEAKRMNEMFIVGGDANPEGLDAIAAGELAGTVDSNAFGQGFVSVDLTCRYLIKGEKPPAQTKIGLGVAKMITKETLPEFKKFREERFKKHGLEPM